MPSLKSEKKVIIENIFGIPLMLCFFVYFLVQGWVGSNFNFKVFRKFIQRNFLIKYMESVLGLVLFAALFLESP